jgi:hypothetical protein
VSGSPIGQGLHAVVRVGMGLIPGLFAFGTFVLEKEYDRSVSNSMTLVKCVSTSDHFIGRIEVEAPGIIPRLSAPPIPLRSVDFTVGQGKSRVLHKRCKGNRTRGERRIRAGCRTDQLRPARRSLVHLHARPSTAGDTSRGGIAGTHNLRSLCVYFRPTTL